MFTHFLREYVTSFVDKRNTVIYYFADTVYRTVVETFQSVLAGDISRKMSDTRWSFIHYRMTFLQALLMLLNAVTRSSVLLRSQTTVFVIREMSSYKLCWRRGVVVSGVGLISEVNRHRARLVLRWVTVCGRVNHLGM